MTFIRLHGNTNGDMMLVNPNLISIIAPNEGPGGGSIVVTTNTAENSLNVRETVDEILGLMQAIVVEKKRL